jgi:cytochrome c biogenesis protein CcmG/thiol:disulfide interchange protein DsbE
MIRQTALLLVLWGGMVLGQPKELPLPSVERVSVHDLQQLMRRDSGDVVVVNFWATWCKPCREEMPSLLRLRKKFGKDRLTLLLVSADDTDDVEHDVRPMLRDAGVDFPTYIANESYETFLTALNPRWKGALAVPMTLVYTPGGALAETMIGGKEYRDFASAVGKALTK